MNRSRLTTALLTLFLGACGGGGEPPSASNGATMGSGEQVYNKKCGICHDSGISSAPRPGHTGDWEARLAQGEAVIMEHALKGYKGQGGFMPPKGGASSLSDDEVKAAVRYMLDKSS